MHRFFTSKENIHDNMIIIDGDDVKHIKNVLRIKEGDEVIVCDGDNSDYLVNIDSISKSQVTATIIEQRKSTGEPPVDVILYQGLPKSSKMDIIVQKSVELGIKEIVPIVTERTVVKLEDSKKENKKLERWNRIALEAAKQSKRGYVPKINKILSFNDMINTLKDEECIIVPYENEENIGIKGILKNTQYSRINIVIGPEGGFEEWEINDLAKNNANIVTLGPRILRTETAGFTTLAVILYEVGDLGVV